jgi:hypothetical protein
MAPASRRLANQYASRARGHHFRDLFPCGAGWRWRHAHCRPGRLGDRLSRRWRNLQGGPRRAWPQHRRDPLVLGGGRPARQRREPLYGLMAAALVLGANTALRPIVHAINRQPIESTEEFLGGAIGDRFAGSSLANIVSVHGPESRTRSCRA